MILQKMLKSRWLVLSLLSGLITAVALISSIPMYTDGILQRLLIKELEQYQITEGKYPGTYQLTKTFRHRDTGKSDPANYPKYHEAITEGLIPELGLSWTARAHSRKISPLYISRELTSGEASKPRAVKIEAIEGLEDHIQIAHGRVFSGERHDGVIEAVVSEHAVKSLNLLLDRVYEIRGPETAMAKPIKLEVVGIFRVKSAQDSFWYRGIETTYQNFFIDYWNFNEQFSDPSTFPNLEADWYYALDYHEIELKTLGRLLSTLHRHTRLVNSYMIAYEIPMIPILEQYFEKEKRLRLTLAFLQVPVLLMLAFFLYMVSTLIIERERNEIAVLKSRGASTWQIFSSYLYSNLLLSGLALGLGPPFGLLICQVIGSTNGFLEFVQRTALPLSLSYKAYLHSLAGLLFFLLTVQVPAYIASKTTIVLHKQSIARGQGGLSWKKIFLDFILLAFSGYGLYRYYSQQEMLTVTGAQGSDLPIDPLLFIISILFILGCSLLFLRLFPYLIEFVFWVGRKTWSPQLYASFINVARSFGHEQFVIIFLVLTVSIGVYNSSAARTINKHIEDKIRYSVGADITLMPYWWTEHSFGDAIEAMKRLEEEAGEPEERVTDSSGKVYIPSREPSFESYARLEGVSKATRVFRKYDVSIRTQDGRSFNAMLLAIVPREFGEIAWFRSDLLPHHWHEYLNLLVRSPSAMLASRSVENNFKVWKGDSIKLTWAGQKDIEGLIYEFIDFWPSFNPFGSEDSLKEPNLIVANLNYIQAKMGLEPYEIWIKKKEGYPSRRMYTEIQSNRMRVTTLNDATLDIIVQKNKPDLQGTNGMLTLGFLVTLGVSLIGFLICWFLSIKGRLLQFGLIRAMGLTRKNIIVIIIWEQILITVPAVLMGILTGGITGQLFVPMLQLVSSKTQQVPPFVVGALWEDYFNLLVFICFMLLSVMVVLGVIISKIKIHQALKLGEE